MCHRLSGYTEHFLIFSLHDLHKSLFYIRLFRLYINTLNETFQEGKITFVKLFTIHVYTEAIACD